jgi:predicted nucleic acid-binding protein
LRPKRHARSAPQLRVAEPRAAYTLRPCLVADATVLAAVVFHGEPEHAQAVALLQGRSLAAPQLVDYEIASVALKKLRRERISSSQVLAALETYFGISMERHAVPAGAVLQVAERHSLTAYDAAYLWLAAELQVPLATFDDRLAEAAAKHLRGDEASQDA